MPYRLRYQAWVDWVPAGIGLGQQAGEGYAGMVPAGPVQTLAFFNSQNASDPPLTNTFTSSDVTTLTNAMASDLSTQMNVAAVLTRVQNFSSGGG